MTGFRILILVLAALAGGLVGYQLGITQAVATAGGSVVYGPGFGFGFGWFFFLFLIFALVFAFRPRWGWGPGPRGDHPGRHGRWHDGFDEWHRRAHEDADRPSSPPADRS